MRHCVRDDIDAHREGAAFRIAAEIFDFFGLAFPTIDQVVVVAQQDHHLALVVKDPVEMRRGVVFNTRYRMVRVTLSPEVDRDRLRFFLKVIDDVENLMVQRQFFWFAIGEDAFQLLVKVVPLFVSPELIDHQESTVEQILSQGPGFCVGENDRSRGDDKDLSLIHI